MKVFTKICLIISVICVCIAALCFGVGIALGSGIEEVQRIADNGELNIGNWKVGRNFFYYGEGSETEAMEMESGKFVTAVKSEEIESLDIDIQYGEVYFTDSDNGEITIHIDAPKRNKYHYKIDGTTLELKDKTSFHRWRFGLNNHKNVTITIGIPAGKKFDEVKLAMGAGEMEISHALTGNEMELKLDAGELNGDHLEALEDFSIDVGAGSLFINDLRTKILDVACGVGEVNLTGTVLEEAEADCGIGEITMSLAGNEKDYDYEINCGIGSVEINEESFSSLSTEKHIDNNADKKISLNCGIGEIHVIVKED